MYASSNTKFPIGYTFLIWIVTSNSTAVIRILVIISDDSCSGTQKNQSFHRKPDQNLFLSTFSSVLQELGIRGQTQTLNRTPELLWFSSVSFQVVSQQCNFKNKPISHFSQCGQKPRSSSKKAKIKTNKSHKKPATKTKSFRCLTVRWCLTSALNTEPALNINISCRQV